jgi:plasmid stability protein
MQVDTGALTSLNIRQLDPTVKEQLRIRAARNGRSMEAEARAILRDTLMTATPGSGDTLLQSIRRRFEPPGSVDLDLPPRGPGREPPSFDE